MPDRDRLQKGNIAAAKREGLMVSSHTALDHGKNEGPQSFFFFLDNEPIKTSYLHFKRHLEIGHVFQL